jgi:hypothetical protein
MRQRGIAAGAAGLQWDILMIETIRTLGRAVFLLCLAALALLAIVQMYSGEAYQNLESILVSVLAITLIVLAFLLVVEVWRQPD